ncbi:MAG: tRNA pseudouridine(13) synthase TruD [Planctomycetes bacterium]|nr:tRNA pseudouridine(13) synthase TruD [Planctomycetota bacterium]MCW8134303.1 tRNA pseudouridine(13) synthase TruD [Planctomycetota bacterium]
MKFATAHIPPCPGIIKSANEDFRVFELPLYPFSGTGTHTLVHIEKAGIGTFEAIHRICKALEYPERDVGSAGLKDARGVTRQWLSFEHLPPEKFTALDVPKVRVLETTRHGNKLKRGHLRGNRFEVTLREVKEADVPHAREALQVLARRGVPNWYDTQRFGRRGDNAACGLSILRADWQAYFDQLLGDPANETDRQAREARQAYVEQGPAAALELWPRRQNNERAALKALLDFGASDKALRKLPQKLKLLQVSAVQSLLFNRVLDARFDDYDRVWAGDICRKENGADFQVTDAALEQPRADAFEISPTGPIFGHKMMQPQGRAAELEAAVLVAEKLTAPMFDIGRGLSQKGDRRPLRFAVGEIDLGFADGALTLGFTLPKGCYATVLLREITKAGPDLAFSGDND